MPRDFYELMHSLSNDLSQGIIGPEELQEALRMFEAESSGNDGDDADNDVEHVGEYAEVHAEPSSHGTRYLEDFMQTYRARVNQVAAQRVQDQRAAQRAQDQNAAEFLHLSENAPTIIRSLPHPSNPSIRIHPQSGNFMPRMREARYARRSK